MLSLLLLTGAAAEISQVCEKSDDCPNRYDAAKAIRAYHGEDTEFLTRNASGPYIDEIGKPRIRAVSCRKISARRARCGFVASYRVSFKGSRCYPTTDRTGPSTGSGCVGDLPKNRWVTYIADLVKQDKAWTIDDAEYVVGLNW